MDDERAGVDVHELVARVARPGLGVGRVASVVECADATGTALVVEAVTVTLRFRTGYVFDVADTEGEDLPEVMVHAVRGARYDALLRQLVAVAERGGLRVRFLHRLPDDANGISYGDGRIDLCANRPDGNMCKTLIHEIAHERLHGTTERATFTTRQLECQAEAVAYGVCQALAVPCPNTPTYLALYRIDRATLAANLDAIRAGVATLMQEIAPVQQARATEDIAA